MDGLYCGSHFVSPRLIISSPPHYWFWLEGATICFCVSIVFWGSGGGGGGWKDAPGNTIYSCHSSLFPIIFAQSLHPHLPSASHIHTNLILFFIFFYFVFSILLSSKHLLLGWIWIPLSPLVLHILWFTPSLCLPHLSAASDLNINRLFLWDFFFFVFLLPCSFSISNHLWLPVFFVFPVCAWWEIVNSSSPGRRKQMILLFFSHFYDCFFFFFFISHL